MITKPMHTDGALPVDLGQWSKLLIPGEKLLSCRASTLASADLDRFFVHQDKGSDLDS